ncbi:MAG: SBDS family ribosome assembly factor [Candidatus Wukongarchaeota archaeon]
MKEDKWLSNGACNVQVELPAGLKAELSDEVSKMTRGKVEVKVVERM